MSVYKAVITTNTELMHFNKNHSRHNGQFISGDGDGDGVVDDHNEGIGKKAFNTYKKVTTNISMVNYVSQKAADNGKAKKQGIIDNHKKEKKKSYLRALKEAFEEGMREGMRENERFSEQQRRDSAEAMRFVQQASQQHVDQMNQQAIQAGQNFMQQQMQFNRQQQMWF